MGRSVLWLRNDLRLANNPALIAALEAGQVVPVFVLDPAMTLGAASRWWLHHSLSSLASEISARGANLVLRRGEARQIIPTLAKQIEADAVHAGKSHEPWLREADRDIATGLSTQRRAFYRHRSALMLDPEQIKTKAGDSYRVYGPFAAACFEAYMPRPLTDAPKRIRGIGQIDSENIDEWELLPTKFDWADGLRATWQPGERGAQQRLTQFLEFGLEPYNERRNLPAAAGTSMLSPHLHWGEISVDAVWLATKAANTKHHVGKNAFLKELLWREFAAHLLWHHETLATAPMKPIFASLLWRRAPTELRAWKRGLTGVPIIDAGMRQLWETGWMHNRVRMMAASFLVKNLLIRWQDGESWFWDTLVDADAASNAASWQWVAGCGVDATPYFRIFNPVLQGQKFDPGGDYVRRYIPELAGLPARYIHSPWIAPESTLRAARVTLGKTYPLPIVDLKASRERALTAFRKLKIAG